MRIIEQTTCADLGRAKPVTTDAIYSSEHRRSFYCFISTDVWTSDGWLVTAIQENGIHHLRKGNQRCTAEVGPDEILHFNPTERTQSFGFGVAKAPAIADDGARPAKVKHERAVQWRHEHGAEAAWIADRVESFEFAGAMHEALEQWGQLTDNQLATVRRLMEQDARRAAERAAAVVAAPQVAPDAALPAVEDAFTRAKAQGIKRPKLLMEGFKLSPAGENSRNPGAIYVTEGSGDGAYLGKVMGGKFLKSRDCSEETQERVLEVLRDPLTAAVAYGKKFGRCAVCGRELENAESIERGIGPVCAARMGW